MIVDNSHTPTLATRASIAERRDKKKARSIGTALSAVPATKARKPMEVRVFLSINAREA
jgi:hypothetical protein